MKWAFRGNRARGFTMIELLVVVALIGLVSTAVLLTMRPNERPLTANDLTLELREQLITLSQRAIGGQSWMGVSFTHQAYQLWGYQESKWQRIATDQDFTIPSEFTVRIEQDGAEVNLPDDPPDQPLILIAPDGRISAFQLEIDDGGEIITLKDPYWFDPHQEGAS
jgi:general secretion pathway protein H